MRKTANPFFAVALGALAVAGFFSCSHSEKIGSRAEEPVSASGVEIGLSTQATTIRNLTQDPIEYGIRHDGTDGVWETRVTQPGSIDRIEAESNLEISYTSGDDPVFNSLETGVPYTFRYVNGDRVQIYLGSHGLEDAEDLAPFVPTPMPVVRRMLEMAGVGAEDIVYDIGCGDGRIVIEAAKTFGARGVGIDIDPEMVAKSKANVEEAGLNDRVEILHMDATRADISAATVVTLYLLPESNELLRPIFEAQLKPGTAVVSHNYSIAGWEDRKIDFDTVLDEHGGEHYIYLYRR
ncbi:MAG: class I SAM-dependent methyltransferase [Acidobacteriota bacterium]|nr:class I SAM-dependent methyltransferase [Acidobacteriota bacterium]